MLAYNIEIASKTHGKVTREDVGDLAIELFDTNGNKVLDTSSNNKDSELYRFAYALMSNKEARETFRKNGFMLNKYRLNTGTTSTPSEEPR